MAARSPAHRFFRLADLVAWNFFRILDRPCREYRGARPAAPPHCHGAFQRLPTQRRWSGSDVLAPTFLIPRPA